MLKELSFMVVLEFKCLPATHGPKWNLQQLLRQPGPDSVFILRFPHCLDGQLAGEISKHLPSAASCQPPAGRCFVLKLTLTPSPLSLLFSLTLHISNTILALSLASQRCDRACIRNRYSYHPSINKMPRKIIDAPSKTDTMPNQRAQAPSPGPHPPSNTMNTGTVGLNLAPLLFTHPGLLQLIPGASGTPVPTGMHREPRDSTQINWTRC